jgi:hypothetical protein
VLPLRICEKMKKGMGFARIKEYLGYSSQAFIYSPSR